MDVKINGDDNDPLGYKRIAMNADHRLDTDALQFVPAMRSFSSGFNLLLNGASGSGKSNLLVNMLRSQNDKKRGIRKSFKKIFDNVVVVSPSLKTLKDDVFDNLKYRFDKWDDETMDALDEVLERNDELDDDEEIEKTLLILDDCGSMLKGETERRFNNMVKNRRHKHLSIICVTQKFKDASTTHRANLTHFISFKPRNALEMESLYTEMIGQERKYMHDIMNGLFKKKYDHLLVDFTQSTNKAGFQYYSNFRPVDFVKK